MIISVLLAASILTFSYGVLVGRYQWPPYHQLASVKQFIFPKEEALYDARYLDKKSFFEIHGKDHYDLVFVGDSITQGGDWYELFPHQRVANRGIPGDTAFGIAHRIDSILSTNASKAFVMLGINDLLRSSSVDEILDHYFEIVAALVDGGMDVFIQSTLYVRDAGGGYLALADQITTLNERLEAFSVAQENVTYIDLNAGLATGTRLASRFTNDGLHLNGQAYAIWREAIIPYMDR